MRKLVQNVAERELIVQQQHLLLRSDLCFVGLWINDDALLLVLISLRFNELALLGFAE